MNRIINSYNTIQLRIILLIVFLFSFIIQSNAQKDRNKLQENKKKPVKKSRFQQRLEDMAKQRGYKR